MPASSKILESTWNRLKAHYATTTQLGAWSRAYRRILGNTYRFLIPSGSRVLEVGCGSGELLQHLHDRSLSGIDLVNEQVRAAQQRLPEGQFTCAAGETACFEQTYDYLLLSDTLNETADVQQLLENLHHAATPETRLVINIHNTLWRPLLGFATLLGLKPKRPQQNWLSSDDLRNLLDLANWEMVRSDARILVPHELLGIGHLINKFIAPLVPCLCLSLFFVARPKQPAKPADSLSVTVIIPARNESGNIEAAIQRTPEMGKSTEIIFVEGNSQDDTWEY
jgi:SAM-dependent methyltransferase